MLCLRGLLKRDTDCLEAAKIATVVTMAGLCVASPAENTISLVISQAERSARFLTATLYLN